MRADAGGVDIYLDDGAFAGVERAIRELGAQQNQRVGVHHGVETGGEADEPGHTDIVRVVVLDVLFTAQRVDDGGFELFSKRGQLIMRPGAAAAAQQSDVA